MTPADLAIVRKQAVMLKADPGPAAAGTALYTRMFERNASLVDMFDKIKKDGHELNKTNTALRMQGELVVIRLFDIIASIGTKVADDLLNDMARSHMRRNVNKDGFDFVGECLMDVLAETLGDKIDKGAWTRVYGHVADEVLKRY